MKWIFGCIAFLYVFSLSGQFDTGFSLGTGRFIKHTPKIQFEAPNLYIYGNLFISKAGSETLAWNKFWSVSEIQHGITFASLGNQDLLGFSICYTAGLHFSLITWNDHALVFSLNPGFSWHSRIYDKLDNPLNNVISSRITNTDRITLHWKYRISKQIQVCAGGYFQHYSNAAIKTPNLGYNTLGLFSSFQIIHNKNITPKNYFPDPFEGQIRPWKYFMFIHYGVKESAAVANGPLFKMGSAGAGVMYHVHNYIRLLAAVEYEWNEEDFAFYKSSLAAYSNKEARKLANSWMIAGGIELLFGPMGFRLSPGFYVQLDEWRSYNRMALYYYFKLPGSSNLFAFGLSLKSHNFDAHYGALTISYQL